MFRRLIIITIIIFFPDILYATESFIYTIGRCDIRNNPNLENSLIALSVPGKKKLEVLEENQYWYKVKIGKNKTGWIQKKFVLADYKKNQTKNIFKQNALKGDPVAARNLGDIYYSEKIYGEAAKWYSFASSKNDGPASENLGNLYLWGLGVKKDLYKAFVLYLYAEKCGHTLGGLSQFIIGYMYGDEDNSFKDIPEAKRRLHIAKSKGIAKADKVLKLIKLRELQHYYHNSRSTAKRSTLPTTTEILTSIFAIGLAVDMIDNNGSQNDISNRSVKNANCPGYIWRPRLIECTSWVKWSGDGSNQSIINADCKGGSRNGRWNCESNADVIGTGTYYCDDKDSTNRDRDINIVISKICN